MRKKLLLVMLLMVPFILCMSQGNPFFYSAGKKIYLSEDTTKVLFRYNNYISSTGQFKKRVQNQDVLSEDTVFNSEIHVLSSRSGRSFELGKSLKRDSTILYSWIALYSNQVPMIATGEILVKPVAGIQVENILTKLDLMDLVDIMPYDTLHFGTSYLQIKNPKDLFDVANKIYESGEVIFSHPNFYVPVVRQTNDPFYSFQDYIHNTAFAGMDINIEPVWPMVRNSTNGVKITIIDDGIEAHEDISKISTAGYTPRSATGNGAPIPTAFHGEGVAGILAADAENFKGVAGVYQGPGTIKGINVFYGGETVGDYANAINYAWQTQQADVINNSWGYPTGAPAGFAAISNAINSARTLGRGGKGTPVVFSAGNTYGAVEYPASDFKVISVGALNSDGTHPSFSATGALTLFCSAVSPAVNQYTTDRMGSAGQYAGNYSPTFGYTSGAAPQVSGVIASMITLNPSLTETSVYNILAGTAHDLGTPGYDGTFGNGLIDGCLAVRSAIISGMELIGPSPNGPGEVSYSISGYPPQPMFGNLVWSATPTGVVTITPIPGFASCYVKKIGTSTGTVTIRASFGNLCGQPVAVQTTLNTASMSAKMAQPAYVISPVPANTYLSISTNPELQKKNPIAEIEVIDKMGGLRKRVKCASGTTSVRVEVGDLPSDYYIIRINDGQSWQQLAKQVIVSH